MVPMRAHTRYLSLLQRIHARIRGLASAPFFGLLLVGLLTGCGSGGSDGGSSGGGSSSSQVISTGVISPDGGQVVGTTPDGQTVVLVIPPDSVPQDVPVSISVSVPSSASAALTTSAPEGLGMVVGRFIGIAANSTYFVKPLTICLPYNSTQIQAGPGQVLRVAVEYEAGWEILRPVSLPSCTGKIAGKFWRLKNGNNPSSFVVVLVDLPRRVLSPVAGKICNPPVGTVTSPQQKGCWSFWQHGTEAHENGNRGHRKSNDYRAWDIHFGLAFDKKDDRVIPPPLGSLQDIADSAGTPYIPGEHIDLNLPVFPVEDGYVEQKFADAVNASKETTNSSNALLIYHPGKGYWSAYLHMNDLRVELGQAVYKDRTLLGLIGTKCNDCSEGKTSPHLHLALYRGANTSHADTGFSELISFDLPDNFLARPNPPSPSQTSFSINSLPSVTAGGTVSSLLTATQLFGTAGTTPMAILGCPNTISCFLNPPSVIPTLSGTQSTLSINTTTSTPSGTYSLTVKAGTDSSIIPLRVTAPLQLTIDTANNFPEGKTGTSYNTTLTAKGGTAPYTWKILRGGLPPGLSLGSGGLISGIPTSSGSFSFRAQVLDSNSQQDQTTFTITVEGIPPAAPTLTVLPECNEETTPQIRLTWTPSSGVDFYQVFRNGFAFAGVADYSTTTSTTFLDTQVTIGTSYTYSIVAINSGGKARSNEVTETARCGVAPGAFTLEVITICMENAPVNFVDWTGASGRTQPYEIYRNSSLLGTRDLSDYYDSAVSGGTTYTYLVRARNSVGQRDSNAVSILTKSDCAAPVAPVITSIAPQSVTVGTGDFTLTVNGQNFDGRTRLLYSSAGDPPPATLFSQLP